MKENNYPVYFLIIVLPFMLLYWMEPFISDYTIGNDYTLYSINEQIELLFSIKTGTVPLYVPGYAQGHSSSALTLGQLYHPISHLASLFPGYWNGKALEWNTFLRLLILGLTQLALFAFLRRLRLNMLFSFLLSLITVYNLRMLEAFRYGASLEAFTGHLLLCTAIGWNFIRPSKWLGPLSIIGATYLLVCSGHPPMMFFGLIGAGLFSFFTPFFVGSMLPERDMNIKTALAFWIKIGLFICLGILLASAYVIPVYFDFIKANTEYALASSGTLGDPPETFVGVLNNFFIPFKADLLGAFGGSSLILLAFYLPLLRLFKIKIPTYLWFLWGILLYAILYILGPQTPAYRLAWQYFPFVSNAGGVGRISMIVPSIIMIMMAWIMNAGAISVRVRNLSLTLPAYSLLAFIALILIPLYILPVFLFKPAVGFFTPYFIRTIPFGIVFLAVLLGMISLALLVVYANNSRFSRVLGIFLCLTIMLQIGTILKYGLWIEKKKDKPTFEMLKAQKKGNQDYNFHQCPGMHHEVVLRHLSHSFLEPFLGKIFTQVETVASQDEAYIQMQKERQPQQLYVEGYDTGKAYKITEHAKSMNEGKVELVYNTFNQLKFRVVSQAPAFFGLSYPYTGHWHAWVNGGEVRVYRANGAAHAIEIPKGESIIEFRYWSDAAFWGVIISCTTFAMIGFFVCFRALSGFNKIIGVVLILTIGVGGLTLWYHSLYNGDNLGTEYTWFYSPPQSSSNLAYGKKTSGFTPESALMQFHSSNAVDGETKLGSGFTLKPGDGKSLIVDLNQIEKINTILLYGKTDYQPLITLSRDGNQWQGVESINAKGNYNDQLRIDFDETQRARFVKIEPFRSELEIDEVEIY